MSWINHVRLKWALALVLIAGAGVWGAYEWRNVAMLFMALAFAAAALGMSIKRLTSLSVVLVASFFALGLGEVLVTITENIGSEPSAYIDPNSGYARSYGYITDIGWQAKPGVYTSKKIAPDGSVIYDVTYSIGDDGFRREEQDHGTSKRVNFFGCSFTFGEGLNDNQTLPFYVHELLKNVKAKNFGFHGYGVHNALAILQSHRKTDGDINFLLTAPWHAERSACKPDYTLGAPRYVLTEKGEVVRAGVCTYPLVGDGALARVVRYSKLFQLISSQLKSSSRDDDFRLYLALVKEMGRLSRERNQKFVIGFIKAKDDYFKGSSFSNEKIYSALKGAADEVVDLTLADKAENLDPKYYIHQLDQHPSALANMTRASILVPVLTGYLAR